MAVRVLVGAQWGDEGKGKIVDWLSRDARLIARFAGGPNAGHTVVIDGKKTVLHHVPCGILNEGPLCLLGNGVVVDARVLADELKRLHEGGVVTAGRILVSPRAHVILEPHRVLDRASEAAAEDGAIGTTGKGIGPAYGDKTLRRGVRVGDLLDDAAREARVRPLVEHTNRMLEILGVAERVDVDETLAEAADAGRLLADMVDDTGARLRQAARDGEEVLLEGAQGALLDIDHGTYPFTTSSSATAGGACTGSGLGPRRIDSVWAVAKAYCTRVGNGPFPSELTGPEGDALRESGGEYGATTGRPRRCGWFDAVAARYALEVNGTDVLAITKLDILTGLEPLRVCTAYRIDGRETTEFPDRIDVLERAQPVWEEHPGWTEPLTGARAVDDLPANARAYLRRLEELTGVRVGLVGVGPNRDQVVEGFGVTVG